MGRLVNTYFIGLLLLLHLSVFAQAEKNSGIPTSFNGNVTEKARLDLNSEIILSGETLLYKVTVVNGRPGDSTNQSKIAYVRLVDKSNKTWFAHKVLIDRGTGSGSFKIPIEAQSGNYKLISYTNWSKNNQESGYFIKDILIINPFLKPEKAPSDSEIGYVLSKREIAPTITKNPNNTVKIELDKAIYGPRELVNLNLVPINPDFTGSFSLSVRKVLPLAVQKQIPEGFYGAVDTSETYLPEFRGEVLSGRIETNDPDLRVDGKTVSLSIPGRDFLFKNAETDAEGKFFFLLDKPYNSTKSILQVIDKKANIYKISVDKNAPDLSQPLNFKNLKLEPELKNWLLDRSMDIQITNAYAETVPTSIIDSASADLFYSPFATRYKLDDYDRFPTMHETFTEIIWDAAMRVDQDQVQLKVYNTENPFNDGLDKLDPLVVIDGIQIQDNILVENLDVKNVDFIDVVPKQYRYGPSYFSGIISIITKNGDFTLPENEERALLFDLPLPINNSGFAQIIDSLAKENKRIPDYRTQLYWDPNVQLEDKEIKIQFNASDLEGVFEVVLKGYGFDEKTIEFKTRFSIDRNHKK